MKIIDFGESKTSNKIVTKLDLNSKLNKFLVDSTLNEYEEDILTLLNSFNGSKVTQFNFKKKTFTADGEMRPWSELTDIRKLACLSLFAEKKKVSVNIVADFSKFTFGETYLYMQTFKGSEYVNIMLNEKGSIQTHFLNNIKQSLA